MWRETLRTEVERRREPARQLVKLAVVLVIATVIIALIGYHMQTSGLQF